jgi:hypothetical protein
VSKNRLDVIRIKPPGRARSRRLPPFNGATSVLVPSNFNW